MDNNLKERKMTKKKVKTVVPTTHVAIVLDKSGSMYGLRSDTVKACNNIFDEIRRSAQDQEVTVSLFTFANKVQTLFFNADIKTLKNLTLNDYIPNGGTAMFDGLGKAIEMFSSLPDVNNENTSFLLLVITDGEENSSVNHFYQTIGASIRHLQKTDRWTFAFNVPRGNYKSHLMSRFNVSSDNIREWETTIQGIKDTGSTTCQSFGNYFQARKCGIKSVSNFYVTTDLSSLQTKDVKNKLGNLKSKFKVLSVDKECPIKSLVETKLGQYQIGNAYYQLTKKEKIQSSKEIVVMEKGKPDIWGGDEARELLGLDYSQDIKVEPGNHSKWDIFVQSTSVNRKLVRGTKLLVKV